MSDDPRHRLQRLVGLPLWGAGVAADLTTFQLGERRQTPSRTRGLRVVGAYALHVQSPWVLESAPATPLARYPPDAERLRVVLAAPRVCTGVAARDDGTLTVTFDDGSVLSVTPSAGDEEYWRLLDEDGGHVVMTASGPRYLAPER